MSKTKQRDKQTSAILEKKTRAETEARVSLERQVAELVAHRPDEAAGATRAVTARLQTYIFIYASH